MEIHKMKKSIQSRYVSVQYDSTKLLKQFDKKLIIGGKLTSMMNEVELIEDRVLAKIDIIIEKAEVELGMFPTNLFLTLVLLPDRSDVGDMYEEMYGKRQRNIAYYSLSKDTIYISVDDTNLKVLAHEIGHFIVDLFFKVRPPSKIHELLAQFVERHIKD